MWDWATVFRDRHIGNHIVIEAPPSLRFDLPFVRIVGQFCSGTWLVQPARSAGARLPANFFPLLGLFIKNFAIKKSRQHVRYTTDEVMALLAEAKNSSTPLLASSQRQIAAFKKTAQKCGWRARPANMNFGIPRIPMAPKEDRPSLAEVRLHM